MLSNFTNQVLLSFKDFSQVFAYLLTIIVLVRFISKGSFFKIKGVPSVYVTGMFFTKIIAGTTLWWFYLNHTTRLNADIFKYFDDSYYIYKAILAKPINFFKLIFETGDLTNLHIEYLDYTHNWYKPIPSLLPNDNRTMIKLNAIFRFISFGSYHIHVLWFNFLSFTGSILLFKSFNPFFKSKKNLILALFITPSFLFWSSGNLKESVLILNLGVYIYCLFGFKKTKALKFLSIGLLSLAFFMFIKIYIILAVLPASAGYLCTKKTGLNSNIRIYAISNTFFLFLILILGYLFNSLSLLHIIEKKQEQFIKHSISISSGSRFELSDLEPTFYSFLQILPESLINTIIRPFIWESKSLLMLISSLENLIIMIIAVICLIRIKKQHLNYNFLFFLFNLWVTTYLIIGYTTPVWGAMSRYKIAVLPFFLLSFIYLSYGKVTRK